MSYFLERSAWKGVYSHAAKTSAVGTGREARNIAENTSRLEAPGRGQVFGAPYGLELLGKTPMAIAVSKMFALTIEHTSYSLPERCKRLTLRTGGGHQS